ncbi:MAG: copper transporter [Solirubrobacterales bacterium]
MGYSGRYHAASLAAVFIALAVGILIGIGLADDVVSSASEELESSLRSDLSDAQDRADSLQSDLDRSDRFGSQIVPEVLAGRLQGRRVAVVELGGTDEALVSAARDAAEAADGELRAVAQIALPPDEDALLDSLPPRFAGLKRDPEALSRIGEAVGRELSGGGPAIRSLESGLFARLSGNLRGVDAIVVARVPPDDLSPGQREETTTFETGILDGIAASPAADVGAELTSTDPSTLAPMIDAGIPTVDHLDLPAGEVALVYALDGYEGNFGVKDQASAYLPDFERGPGSP